ncbi:MAG: HIT family protein [Candidatus Kerfeldbacteria bacterium]|nr:HIT family protein [Candidatus Kerfeldbacteria bacterium]
MACIFCEIITKQAPASIVYEDADILGFMDIQPIHNAQCMLIPKEHIDHFTDIPEELAGRMMQIAQRIGKNILREFKPQRIGYVVHGYGVAHAHLVIVPQHHEEDITSQHLAVIKDGKISFIAENLPVASREELDDSAAKIYV